MWTRLRNWWNCRRGRHGWTLVWDSGVYHDGFLYRRHVLFVCRQCGKAATFDRWAFVPKSGALEYFFGRVGWKVEKLENVEQNTRSILHVLES